MVIAVPSKHMAGLALAPKQKNFTWENHNMTNIAPTHAGVNVLLGGAMMSCMVAMVICICYFCHWRFQKVEERYGGSDSWIQNTDSDPPMQIFTLDQQCYDGSDIYGDEENFDLPPPDYEDVVSTKNEANDPDLPSYEAAVKLSAQGYV